MELLVARGAGGRRGVPRQLLPVRAVLGDHGRLGQPDIN